MVLLACNFLHEREPSYQGRSLSSWLHIYSTSVSQPERNEARQAILQLGPNAIPSLMRWMRYSPSAWKRISIPVFQALYRSPAKVIVPDALIIDNSAYLAEKAALGFELLGHTAEPALPGLAELASDSSHPERSARAMRTLITMRPVGNSAIRQVLSGAVSQTRLNTLRYIAGVHDQSMTRDLLPDLIQCLRGSDGQVARCAAFIITEQKHREPDATLTILLDAKNHADPHVRAEVIKCIATFERGAISAVPSLMQSLLDCDLTVRKEATNALRHIAPETFANAPAR